MGDRTAKIQHYMGLTSQLVEGKVVSELPWNDPDFQRAVLESFKRCAKWKADAEKLAVVKEVFGGAK